MIQQAEQGAGQEPPARPEFDVEVNVRNPKLKPERRRQAVRQL